jgi:hypothetical protein
MPKRSSGNTPQPQTQKRIDDQAAKSILKKLGEKSGLVPGRQRSQDSRAYEFISLGEFALDSSRTAF